MRELKAKIQSPTYHYTKLQNKLYGEIHNYIENTEGMSRTKLADKLGVTKGYISQLMNNGADHKLSKLIKLTLAIGKVPSIEFMEPAVYLEKEFATREERKPLDLDQMGEHLCQLYEGQKIQKEDQAHDFMTSPKLYSTF